MNFTDQILNYIQSNRVSTTEIADALGKDGVLPGLRPLVTEQYRVGRIRTIFAANGSNYSVHEQIRDVQAGDVVLIFVHNCGDKAILGDLISKFLLIYRQVAAVVVDGLVRDAARLRRENYAVWSAGVTPLGCHNKPAPPFPEDQAEKLRNDYDGGLAICDEGGVVLIPSRHLGKELLERIKRVETQEDLWYYCLDTLKWDTKRIVCDKDYFSELDSVPKPFKAAFDALQVGFSKFED